MLAALSSAEPRAVAEPRSVVEPVETPAVTWAYSDEQYLDMIAACQAVIREGDAYQLCLTTEARVDARPDPYAACLLYTSDAADDLLCVDLGGRRIITKKKTKTRQHYDTQKT